MVRLIGVVVLMGCGGSTGGVDAGVGVQSACSATSAQVTCNDAHETALCTITPRSCTSNGVGFVGPNYSDDPFWEVNAGSGTCAQLEAPLNGGGAAASGAPCSKSHDCALVCCGCAKPGWIFASSICVQGHCAAPASVCAWAYTDDPLVCGGS